MAQRIECLRGFVADYARLAGPGPAVAGDHAG
jgi:hypothetical protein